MLFCIWNFILHSDLRDWRGVKCLFVKQNCEDAISISFNEEQRAREGGIEVWEEPIVIFATSKLTVSTLDHSEITDIAHTHCVD